ncbi:hypothetical protein [Pseudomonas promysalinigenes]|uniref:hypothetical protein n=1 Tax=Pseudomonas promysalinigenes TaxID=485898 RepID=UPI001646FCA7|nr:hypothetical protein [Pseudomonas promysalinigenes]QXI32035.1 hypothetical protein HU725_013345 [Pseudomonas promysalinigenes]
MSNRMVSNVRRENFSLEFVNDELPSFPPPDDFPVCVDENGSVLARFCDDSWPMQQWLRKSCAFTFGMKTSKRSRPWLTQGESYLFRLLLILIMWVTPDRMEPSTLQSRYNNIKRIFRFCSNNKISVADLHRYPQLVLEFTAAISKFAANYIYIFRTIYEYEGLLGFKILNSAQIYDLYCVSRKNHSTQTPYIPSRLSNLHLVRSLELIRDYKRSSAAFEGLFDYVWQEYQANNKGWVRGSKFISPFSSRASRNLIYRGPFEQVAEEYGVKDVLDKWMFGSARRPCRGMTVSTLSSFFGAISLVGATCIASMSGMRRGEINELRVDCFDVAELDGETVYVLRGETTKTIKDDDARWITCEDVRDVIAAMSSVAKLRMKVAIALGVSHEEGEVDNPYLVLRSYEPWSTGYSEAIAIPTSVRKSIDAISLDAQCPSLFLPGDLIITDDDFKEALKVNPDLNVKRFAVGKDWVFAFHQFRRTLMVNACHSQQVSPQSLQYQLKHLYLSMSMYYGRNASALAFNSKVRDEYISTAYESMGRTIMDLKSPNFVSPISTVHKERAVNFLEAKALKQLVAQAKKGMTFIKETIQGVCLSTEPCEYGSADYVLACKNCVSGLASKENLPVITRVNHWLESQLEHAPQEGPRKDALLAQHEYTQHLINVILVEE